MAEDSPSALLDKVRESIRVGFEWGLDVREVFEKFDEDFSGVISFKEFTYALRDLGFHYVNNSKPLRQAMLHTPFLTNSSSRVNYRDLLIDCLSPETYARLPSFACYKVQESLCRIKALIDSKGFQAVFNYFDSQEQGYIDRISFRRGLQKMGLNLSMAEIRSIMRHFEKQGSPLIDLRRFVEGFNGNAAALDTTRSALAKLRHRINLAVRSKRTTYEYVFHLFDTNQDGLISVQELSTGFKDLGIDETVVVLTEAFKDYMDADGRLTFDQFVRAISPEFVEDPLDRLRLLIETTRRRKSITHEEVFNFFNKEKKKVLSIQDLLSGFKTLDIPADQEVVNNAFSPFFSSGTETLTFESFVHAIQNKRRDQRMTPIQRLQLMVKQSQERLKLSDRDLIQLIDTVNKGASNGQISLDAIVSVLRELKVNLDVQVITKAFAAFLSSDGFVSYVHVLRLLLPEYMNDPLDLLRMLKRRRHVTEKELFKAFDVHKKGSITLRDLQHTLALMGSQQPLERIKTAFAPFLDDSQALTFNRFTKALQESVGSVTEGSEQSINPPLLELRKAVEDAFVGHQLHIKGFMECFTDAETDTLTLETLSDGFAKLNIDISAEKLRAALRGFLHSNTNAISSHNFMAACIPNFHDSILQEGSRVDVTMTALCRHVLSAMKRGISLEECFKHFVPDETGHISKAAFAEGLRRLDMSLSEEEIEGIVLKFGNGREGKTIDLEGFKAMIKTYAVDESNLEDLLDQIRLIVTNAHAKGVDYVKCFQHFDKDLSGLIDAQEFQSGISRLGLTLTDAQVASILRRYGLSKKGELGISYNNFLSILGVSADNQKEILALFKRLRLDSFLLDRSIAEMRKLFHNADSSGNGCCTRQVFLDILQQMRFNLTPDQTHLLLHYFDPKADGFVDYRHFLARLEPKVGTKELREAVHKLRRSVLEDAAFDVQRLALAFKHFDLRGEGLITKREFRCGLHALRFKVKLSSKDVEALCDVFDFRSNSRIDTKLFVDFVLRLSGRSSYIRDELKDADGAAAALEEELVEFVEMAQEMNIPLEEAFKQFDPNSNGVVTFEEFQSTLYKLGFPSDAEQLKSILLRINSAEHSKDHVLYADFLAYFRRKAKHLLGEDVREEELLKEKQRVLEECRQEAKLMLSHGKRPTKAFEKFDRQLTGLLPSSSFEEAFHLTFHPSVKASPAVITQLVQDFTKSAHLVNYLAFLDINQPKQKAISSSTWQQVFSKSRERRQALLSKGIAKSVVESILERMEDEIANKGPLWRQARKRISKRVNNATFINRNKASVHAQSIHKHIPASTDSAPVKDKARAPEAKSEVEAKEKALLTRRDVLAAEAVATRLMQEATLREEEMAVNQQLKAQEQDAIEHAAGRIDHKVRFPSGEQANLFLTSIGLGRFAKQPPKLKGVDFSLKDDQELKDRIGTCSTIVARKVKRELLLLLRRNLDMAKVVKNRIDPGSWSVMQAAVYIKDLGFPTKAFLDNRIDGQTLLQLTVEEARTELNMDDSLSAQSLVFCIALVHYLSQHKASLARIGEEPICSAIRVDGSALARPSSQPLSEWTSEEVQQLICSLGMEPSGFVTHSIDGAALLDISENDLLKELNLSPANARKLLHLIQVLRQPPWLCLGTGPYLEVGVSVKDNPHHQDSLGYDSRRQCLTILPRRDTHLFIRIRPALKLAMDAVEAELKEAHSGRTSAEKASSAPEEDMEAKIISHITKAKEAGINVENVFAEKDSLKEGSLPTSSFMEALKATGFDISKHSAVSLLNYLDSFKRGQVRYKRLLQAAKHPVESHNLVFDRERTPASVGITADGTMATLFASSGPQQRQTTAFIFPGTVVSVRYKGGNAKYDALIVRQNKNGTYVVEYLDEEARSINVEETVHQEWVSLKGEPTDSHTKSNGSSRKPVIAAATTSFAAGVHQWTAVLKHSTKEAAFGVERRILGQKEEKDPQNPQFVGSTLQEMCLEKGDSVHVQLDLFLRTIELRVERDGKEIDTKKRTLAVSELYGSIDALTELKARLRTKLKALEQKMVRQSVDGRLLHVDSLVRVIKSFGDCAQTSDEVIREFAKPFMSQTLDQTVDLVSIISAINERKSQLDFGVAFYPAVKLFNHGDTVQWKHSKEDSSFKTDDQVLVRYAGGNTWYEAVVKARDKRTGVYVVEYETSGVVEQGVLGSNIKHRDNNDSTKDEPLSRLVLKLYCSFVEYTCRTKQKQQQKVGRKSKSKHAHQLPTASKNVKSFSSEDGKAIPALLRRRVLTNGFSHHMDASRHVAFSPHLVKEKAASGEAGWIYLGQIQLREIHALYEYDNGIGMVVNLAHDSDIDVAFQKLCVMGVLYKISADGEELCKAPVEPLKSLLSDQRFRGKNLVAYQDKAKVINESSLATHFCLLSKPFRTSASHSYIETGSTLAARSLKPTQAQIRSPVRQKPPQKAKSQESTPPPVQRKLFLPEDDDAERGTTSSIDRDEEICIDRWLALNRLTEFGHEPDSNISYKNSPILDPATGLRKMSRYEYVALLHPSRPWLSIGVTSKWLPEEEERERFEDWVAATLPEVNSDRSKTQYEVVCSLYPARPWLRRKKTWDVKKKEKALSSESTYEAERLRRKRLKKHQKSVRAYDRLNKQVAETNKSVSSTLTSLEENERKVRLLKASIENASKSNLPNVTAADAERANELLAEEARLRQKATFEAELAQEQQLQRLEALEEKERRVREKEDYLDHKTGMLEAQEKARLWADRITMKATRSVGGTSKPRNKPKIFTLQGASVFESKASSDQEKVFSAVEKAAKEQKHYCPL